MVAGFFISATRRTGCFDRTPRNAWQLYVRDAVDRCVTSLRVAALGGWGRKPPHASRRRCPKRGAAAALDEGFTLTATVHDVPHPNNVLPLVLGMSILLSR